MTGALPYADKNRDPSITQALYQKELPADVAAIKDLPDFVRTILERCWRWKPESRVDMAWCQSCLTIRATTRLFNGLEKDHFADVPSRYIAQGDGWEIFRNPELDLQLECEVTSIENGSRSVGYPRMEVSG